MRFAVVVICFASRIGSTVAELAAALGAIGYSLNPE